MRVRWEILELERNEPPRRHPREADGAVDGRGGDGAAVAAAAASESDDDDDDDEGDEADEVAADDDDEGEEEQEEKEEEEDDDDDASRSDDDDDDDDDDDGDDDGDGDGDGDDGGGGLGDGEEDEEIELHIAMDELLGLRGPLVNVTRNVSWLIVFNAAYLGIFASAAARRSKGRRLGLLERPGRGRSRDARRRRGRVAPSKESHIESPRESFPRARGEKVEKVVADR